VRPRPSVDQGSSVDQANDVGHSVQRFAELMDQLESGRLPRRRWRDRVLIKRVP
jgi:hypothetical protein